VTTFLTILLLIVLPISIRLYVSHRAEQAREAREQAQPGGTGHRDRDT